MQLADPSTKGTVLLGRLLKMRSLADDDETVSVDLKKGSALAQPAWMRALKQSCLDWLQILPTVSSEASPARSASTDPLVPPQAVPTLRGTASVQDPLARFFEREVAVGTKLLRRVRADLDDLIQVCDGSLKQTNDIRRLLSDLTKGSVPTSWRRYRCRDLSAGAWIADLAKRLAQLGSIVESGDLGGSATSLGLLFHPHGFVTASRQAVAHATNSSLEQLSLQVDLEKTGAEGSFVIEGECSSLPFSL